MYKSRVLVDVLWCLRHSKRNGNIDLDGNILFSVDRSGAELRGIRCVTQGQRGLTIKHCQISSTVIQIAVDPCLIHEIDGITVGRGIAIPNVAVFKGQLRLENLYHSTSSPGFAFGRNGAGLFRCYSDFQHVSEIRGDLIKTTRRVSGGCNLNINIFVLPWFEAKVWLVEIELDSTYFDFRSQLEIILINRLPIIASKVCVRDVDCDRF